MYDKTRVFKLLKVTIIVLAAILVWINILYIRTACHTRQCFTINIATLLLVLWVTAFWFVVVKYIDKEKK